MRTRKGIYKTRKRIKNKRKATIRKRYRIRRTYKKLKGGMIQFPYLPTFSWKKKVEEAEKPRSAIDILGQGVVESSTALARTTSNAMKLVSNTAERSTEIAATSVNLGLNITEGTVETTNLVFLTINTVLKRCLNFIKRRFDESYTQISQCRDSGYDTPGECVRSCIKPIIDEYSKNFKSNRPSEYENLLSSIDNNYLLIKKCINYFCKRGYLYGTSCDVDIKRHKEGSKILYENLKKNVED